MSLTFAASHFFRYKYVGSESSPQKFYCSILIRALLSIFRSRTGDAGKGGNSDSSIERCDVSIDDGPRTKSRFVAKIAWRNGITATHAIPFESKAPTVATFDESKADNRWSISAHTLRRLMEHFGPKVELLDINTEGNSVLNLTCFTEKQYTKTEGILNMNLHTSIAVKMDDFDTIDIEDKHHIIINVKDFRAILQHACTTTGNLAAHYSQPWSPLRFSYVDNGLYCQFVLMTLGERSDEASSRRAKSRMRSTPRVPPNVPARSGTAASTRIDVDSPMAMSNGAAVTPFPRDDSATANRPVLLPPSVTPSAFEMRPPTAAPSTIPAGLLDDDSQWEPVNPDEDNPGFVQIEWDESLQPELTFVPINNDHEFQETVDEAAPGGNTGGLEPTQRLTQVRKFGLFD